MTPRGLIEVAESICPSGPGRPAQAALRRAVSTAYYALFTALTEEVARPFAPGARPAARRLLDHAAAHDVLRRLRNTGRVPWLEDHPACQADLMTVAKAYFDLYVQRRLADYDYTHVPNKDDTLKAIEQAKIGIGGLKKARDRCPQQLDIVCVAMIASGSARRRMVRGV